MISEQSLLAITDEAVQEITRKVAQLEMTKIISAELDAERINSIIVSTSRGCELTFVFCAEGRILRKITEQMKHGRILNEDEIEPYVVEYFNILCGHVITAMNNTTHQSMRFGIPILQKGAYIDEGEPPSDVLEGLCYESSHGHVKMQIYCRGKDIIK